MSSEEKKITILAPLGGLPKDVYDELVRRVELIEKEFEQRGELIPRIKKVDFAVAAIINLIITVIYFVGISI